MPADAKNALHIGRIRTEYLVASAHRWPDRVRSRFDDAAAGSLAHNLSIAAGPLFPESDPSLWLIRRLEADLDVNASWDRERLAKQWASQIARVLAGHLEGSGDGQNVLRFDDRPAYVAGFLADLAGGSAWGKWYYSRFDGLRMLPVSAALRTAICEEPEGGADALLRLSPDELGTVLRALNAQDAHRVLASIAGDARIADGEQCLLAACDALRSGKTPSLRTAEEWNDALGLYLSVCRARKALSGPTLMTTSRSLVRFARLLSGASGSERVRIVDAVCGGVAPGLHAAMSASDAECLAPLAACPSGRVQDAAALIDERCCRCCGEVGDEANEAPSVRQTLFGGIFLLLPVLAELPLEDAVRGWPEERDCPNVPLVRILIASKCFGASQAPRVFGDPLIRGLMGMPPDFPRSALRQWSQNVDRQAIERFGRTLSLARQGCGGRPACRTTLLRDRAHLSLVESFPLSRVLDRALTRAALTALRSFAARLPGFAHSSAEHLARNFLDFPATVEEESGSRIVRLGRPPLNLVLGMAGMTRQAYRVEWLEDRPFLLFQEE